jgi:hypothetical protein
MLPQNGINAMYNKTLFESLNSNRDMKTERRLSRDDGYPHNHNSKESPAFAVTVELQYQTAAFVAQIDC